MNKHEIIIAMKERVLQANLLLPEVGLVKLTWGNVSEINREIGVIVIKPSGVPYAEMHMEQMVVTDLEGVPIEDNSLLPSSDLPTHVMLYQNFPHVNSIVHTHSKNAVFWAQANRSIPAYGTTHADTFYGEVPCTRKLSKDEIKQAYEVETGKVIVETFTDLGINPDDVPGVIVSGHGPFTWGDSPQKAVENSIVLDEIAEMAVFTEHINPEISSIDQYLLDKHYFRKHGANAYYGQK